MPTDNITMLLSQFTLTKNLSIGRFFIQKYDF